MPSPKNIIDEAVKRIQEEARFASVDDDGIRLLRQIIGQAVASENEACMVHLWNATEGSERDAMLQRFAEVEHLSHRDPRGALVTCNLKTPYWTRWYPGLELDDATVGEILDTLPGLDSEDIPAIIRAFESPTSPLRLPGACSLEQHDVLHVLLGRGLVDQDEAFVLGFSAVADPRFSVEDIQRYKMAFSLYPEPFCIRGGDLLAFDLGVKAAQRMSLRGIMEIDVATMRPLSVAEARKQLGIDKEVLYDIYEQERQLIPLTPWSHRLPVRPTSR